MPLMVGTTIAFWVVCLVLGFALLYLPVVHDAAQFATKEGTGETAFGDALYFSAVSFFTLGYGDVVPLQRLPRLGAVVEGAFGLLTISFSVAYLLSVYPAIRRKIALAAALNQETAGRADAVVVAQRYVVEQRYDRLSERMRWLNDELLALGQAHNAYPMVFYARPREVHESFVRVLAVVQGWVTTLRYALDPDAHPQVVRDPGLAILEEGLLYTLHGLNRFSHLAVAEAKPEPARVRADFAALVVELAQRGLSPLDAEDPQALAEYARFRAGTDPYIEAYAVNSDYDPHEVWATYSRWARDAALVARPVQATDAESVAAAAAPAAHNVGASRTGAA
jgi:hypothetical protein